MTAHAPALPRGSIDSFFPSIAVNANQFTVASGGSINTALTLAAAAATSTGQSQYVIATSGGSYPEAVVFPAKARSAGRVFLVPSGTRPASGTRLTPALYASHNLPTIVAPNHQNAFAWAAGANNYTVAGFRIAASTTESTYAYVDITPGCPTSPTEDATGNSLEHIFVDGNPAHQTRRFGIRFNCGLSRLKDSWIEQINFDGVTYAQQSQAIAAHAGRGKLYVDNCFLWSATQSYNFGGAFQDLGLAPEQFIYSDVTFRRCHFYRPLNLRRDPSDPLAEGCANNGELKLGRRFLFDGCIFDGSWTDLQDGFGFTAWSVNQLQNNPFTQVSDVTVRNCWYRNNAALFTAQEIYSVDYPAIRATRFAFENNIATGLGGTSTYNWNATQATNKGLRLTGQMHDVSWKRNTFFVSGQGVTFEVDTNAHAGMSTNFDRVDILDNICGYQAVGGYVFYNSAGNNGQTAWNALNGTSTNQFSGNVCVDPSATTTPNTGTNTVLASIAAVGYVDPTVFNDQTVAYGGLITRAQRVGSTYDGKGCDMVALAAIMNGVEADRAVLTARFG